MIMIDKFNLIIIKLDKLDKLNRRKLKMASYIHAYHNGQQISEGTGLSPLVVGPLNASDNEVSEAKALELKTEAGFKTYGDTTISFEGNTSSKWMISLTESGDYTSSVTISDEITADGTTVYVKAKATDDEAPANDTTTTIKLSCVIQAC
jgi:hypothetical protein